MWKNFSVKRNHIFRQSCIPGSGGKVPCCLKRTDDQKEKNGHLIQRTGKSSQRMNKFLPSVSPRKNLCKRSKRICVETLFTKLWKCFFFFIPCQRNMAANIRWLVLAFYACILELFLKSRRLGILVKTFDKMPADKQQPHLNIAGNFLNSL